MGTNKIVPGICPHDLLRDRSRNRNICYSDLSHETAMHSRANRLVDKIWTKKKYPQSNRSGVFPLFCYALVFLMFYFMVLNKRLDIIMINQHLSPNLHARQLAIPNLTAPKPYGRPDLFYEFLDWIKPFHGHSLGTLACIHLICLHIFRGVGFKILRSGWNFDKKIGQEKN